MGGKSKSSSSNTSIVETDNSNLQQNDNEVALNLEDVGDNNTITLSDSGAIDKAFEFGGDALDFGTESLRHSQEFGRDILNEASEISREAIQVAGNAQTNAFAKIKDIASSLTNSASSNTTTILLAIGGAVAVVGMVVLLRRKK